MASGKGSQFERDIARALSNWWTLGQRDDIFWRSAMSGGMATTRRKQGKAIKTHIGDLVAVDPIGAPLIESTIIELKRGYKNWCLLDVLDSNKPKTTVFNKFLEQVELECQAAKLTMFLLICRRDRREPVVISPAKFSANSIGYKDIHVSKLANLLALPIQEYLEIAKEINCTGCQTKAPCAV
jgi:hypothetical protein